MTDDHKMLSELHGCDRCEHLAGVLSNLLLFVVVEPGAERILAEAQQAIAHLAVRTR